MIKKWMMSNGLWVRVEEMPHSPVVGISLSIKGGARCDNDNKQGIAHFLEHLFFKGTEKYPDSDVLESLVEDDGGMWNAMTSHESICCYTSVFKESVEKAIDAISQMVFHPLFREEDIGVERGAIISEINGSQDDPADCVFELYRSVAWGGHPVGRDILGPREHIESAARSDFLDYHAKYFYPGNMVLSVAGDISAGEIFDLCFRYFNHGENLQRTVFNGKISPSLNRISVLEKDSAQINVVLGTAALGWLANKKNSNKTPAAMLLMHILCDSKHLFKKVRKEKGLVYGINSGVSLLSDGGLAYTHFGAELGKAQVALRITFEQYEDVLKNGITELDLRRAKLSFKRNYAERAQSPLSVAISGGSSELLTEESLCASEEFSKYFESLKCDDLMSVAPELLSKENLYLVLVGKIGDKRKEFEDIFIT